MKISLFSKMRDEDTSLKTSALFIQITNNSMLEKIDTAQLSSKDTKLGNTNCPYEADVLP